MQPTAHLHAGPQGLGALLKGRSVAAVSRAAGKAFDIAARTKSAAFASQHHKPDRRVLRQARHGLGQFEKNFCRQRVARGWSIEGQCGNAVGKCFFKFRGHG